MLPPPTFVTHSAPRPAAQDPSSTARRLPWCSRRYDSEPFRSSVGFLRSPPTTIRLYAADHKSARLESPPSTECSPKQALYFANGRRHSVQETHTECQLLSPGFGAGDKRIGQGQEMWTPGLWPERVWGVPRAARTDREIPLEKTECVWPDSNRDRGPSPEPD